MSAEETSEVTELSDLFQLTKTSGTNESYIILLEKLHSSSISIPDIVVESLPTSHGYALAVKALNADQYFGTLLESVQRIRSEFLKNKTDDLQIKSSMNSNRDDTEADRKQFSSFLSDIKRDQRESDDTGEDLVIKNSKDSFTFLMINPLSLAGFIALFVFFVQLVSFFLSVSYLSLNPNATSSFIPNEDTLDLPKGVEDSVHVAQGIALLLIIMVHQSIWDSTCNLYTGFNINLEKQGLKKKWWLLSNYLRLFEGLVATFVTFVLVIRAFDVLELFKDFTAMAFISSFDNIVYVLADMSVVGARLKNTVTRCESIIYMANQQVTKSSPIKNPSKFYRARRIIFHPSLFALSLFIAMSAAWIDLVLVPHMNESMLCQTLYMQFDDKVDSRLSYFSGSFELLNGDEKRKGFPTYRENKPYFQQNYNNKKDPRMILRFCNNLGFWVITMEKENEDDECNEDLAFVMSPPVFYNLKYDILAVSQNDWDVMQEVDDRRWMPLEDFRMDCEDEEPKYSMDETEQCTSIEIDERQESFISTRVWATNFTVVKTDSDDIMLVYNHPVYSSVRENYEQEQELIMYLGKRWIITSTNEFKDYTNKTQSDGKQLDLRTYLTKHFHARWSDYQVAFFSEPILTDTPSDVMTPVVLSWVVASPKIPLATQFADENRAVESFLVCSNCNEKSNPCFYEGICQADKT